MWVLNGSMVQSILHGQIVLVLGQFGLACSEPDGSRRFKESWYMIMYSLRCVYELRFVVLVPKSGLVD